MIDTHQMLIDTPFGSAKLTKTFDQITIALSTDKTNTVTNSVHLFEKDSIFHITAHWLMAYFNQPNLKFELEKYLPIERLKGTHYQKRVWQAIANIPFGQTLSYTEIAKALHSSPRAVANACGANSLPILIPCHRVVAKQGIGGFMRGKSEGLIIKQWLLNHEGINFA
jgi:methylated-DNA-[protein]-cysteine S-methyltransferase